MADSGIQMVVVDSRGTPTSLISRRFICFPAIQPFLPLPGNQFRMWYILMYTQTR